MLKIISFYTTHYAYPRQANWNFLKFRFVKFLNSFLLILFFFLFFNVTPVLANLTAETIVTRVTPRDVGHYSSLQLDSSGNPVVSYFDLTNTSLKLLHCNDVNCSGGNESIEAVDATGIVGQGSSLRLDSSGNPVISYFDATNNDLKLLHCNDVNCSGGNESIGTEDSTGIVGLHTSLRLDSSGNPVVSYLNDTTDDLKLLHCNDVNCSGGNESIETVDSTEIVGLYTSLQLDSSGNPVISYLNDTTDDLKLLHCNDVNCSGGNESIETVDATGNVGKYTSLQLDSSGNPVISYHDDTNLGLKLTHCSDANCSGSNESIETAEEGEPNRSIGDPSGITVGSDGFPRIAYYDNLYYKLKYIQCTNISCSTKNTSDVDTNIGTSSKAKASIKIGSDGLPRIAYFDGNNSNLKYAVCNDDACSSPTVTTILTPDVGIAGKEASLALDSSNNAYIVYHHGTNDSSGGQLELARHVGSGGTGCTSSAWKCTIIATPGSFGSIKLDPVDGLPRIAYGDFIAQTSNLKYIVCGDADCTVGSQTVTTVDSPSGDKADQAAVLDLDSSGTPFIAYHTGTGGGENVKLAYYIGSGGSGCTSTAWTCTTVDSPSGRNISMTLGSDGFARISNYSNATGALKDLVYIECQDTSCSLKETTTLDSTGDVGSFNSITIDSCDNPFISYLDVTNATLKFAYDTSANCPAPTPTPTAAPAPTATPVPGSSQNPDCPSGYSVCPNAGPILNGMQTISSDGPVSGQGQLLVNPLPGSMSLAVTIDTQTPTQLSTAPIPIPFPWTQGFNTVTDVFNYSAVSAFNGYPVNTLSSPATIILPYNPKLLAGRSPQSLRIAYFNPTTKRWQILPFNTVVNPLTNTIANTTKLMGYYTVVYPRSSGGTTASIPVKKKPRVQGASTKQTIPKTEAKKTIQKPEPPKKTCFFFICL